MHHSDDVGVALPRAAPFVARSELRVDPAHADELINSFQQRMGLVDRWPGFQGLEVWQDQGDRGRFEMVLWWSSRQEFVSYMRSDDHRRSHDRIPRGPAAPRPVRLSRFDIIAR